MNFLDHQEKVEQFYKVQEDIYRLLGAFKLTPTNSKAKKIAYRIYGALSLIWIGVYVISLSISFVILPSILDKIMKAFYMLGTMVAAMAKYVFVKQNIALYQELGNSLHKNIFKPQNRVENGIFLKHFKISTLVRNWYGYVSFTSLLYSFVLQQILNPMELPAVLYVPFDLNNSTNLLIVKAYSFIAVGYFCFFNIAFDSWSSSFMIFFDAQLQILEYRLENIGKNCESDLVINTELKKCIQLHAEVYETIGKLETAIAFPVSLQIFCSMLVLCCNFYAISFTPITDDIVEFARFSIYQMAMLAQIFLVCFFANEMTLSSERLSHALYSSDWISWNKVNRKLVLLTMLRFRDPIRVRSLNRCYHYDLAAFTAIVNTSYSYFALLKQMNN